jgi:hypothetical protein
VIDGMEIRIERFLKNIWPTVYKIVNGTFYFLLNLIKSTVKYAIEEIRSSGSR